MMLDTESLNLTETLVHSKNALVVKIIEDDGKQIIDHVS